MFGSRTQVARADVVFESNLGVFRSEMTEAQRVYDRTTGAMSTDALRLAAAQERVNRAVDRYGPESLQAKQATVGLRQEMDRLALSASRADKSIDGIDTRTSRASAAVGRLRGSMMSFTPSVLGGAGFVYAAQQAVAAASEAQNVLGQTSVALEAAGLSWEQWAGRIEQAISRQSRAFAFDDEALLRTFQTFVRQTGDVEEALRRNALAADVARARYIDLEQAAQIVNKASLGQSGALRRLGIDVDKNASATELLTELQRQFGGAAEKAANDAALAQDRLRIATENLYESLGTLLLPAVSEGATILADAAQQAERLADGLGRVGSVQIGGGVSVGGAFGAVWNQVKPGWAYAIPGFGPGIRGGQTAWNLLFGDDGDTAESPGLLGGDRDRPNMGVPVPGRPTMPRRTVSEQLTAARLQVARSGDRAEPQLVAALRRQVEVARKYQKVQQDLLRRGVGDAKAHQATIAKLQAEETAALNELAAIEQAHAAEKQRLEDEAERRREEEERRRQDAQRKREQKAREKQERMRRDSERISAILTPGPYATTSSGFAAGGISPAAAAAMRKSTEAKGGLTAADVSRQIFEFLSRFEDLNRRYAGTNVTVNQTFPTPTPDRAMEARYARWGMEAAFAG